MGAVIGAGDKKSMNIDLNIVPFVDVMSCMTAFLLVTAVWVNIAQVNMHAGGRNREGTEQIEPDPKLSVLIEKDDIWVGVSRVEDYVKIQRDANGSEWARLEQTLKEKKASSFFDTKTDIEVAALSTTESPVSYANIVTTMDIALKTGFFDVQVTDPKGLSAYPRL